MGLCGDRVEVPGNPPSNIGGSPGMGGFFFYPDWVVGRVFASNVGLPVNARYSMKIAPI